MKNVHMCYIRMTEEKNENLKKEGKMRVSTLVFHLHNTICLSESTQNFIILNSA